MFFAKIHFVNWNSTKYPNVQEAMKSNHPNGLLVLAVFAKIGQENSELSKITKYFQSIHSKGEIDIMTEYIDWMNLFPSESKKQNSMSSETSNCYKYSLLLCFKKI